MIRGGVFSAGCHQMGTGGGARYSRPVMRCGTTASGTRVASWNGTIRAALMGNFHITHASRDESWVTVGEWQPRNHISGDLLLARIHWSKPNTLAHCQREQDLPWLEMRFANI